MRAARGLALGLALGAALAGCAEPEPPLYHERVLAMATWVDVTLAADSAAAAAVDEEAASMRMPAAGRCLDAGTSMFGARGELAAGECRLARWPPRCWMTVLGFFFFLHVVSSGAILMIQSSLPSR